MYFKFKHEIYVLKQKERKRRKRNMVFFKKIRFEKFERTISENHCFYVK